MSKVVVITGCSAGIGREMALIYIKEGYQVVGIDVQIPGEELKLSAFYSVDVSKEDEVKNVARDIKMKFGAPAVWYNNAGIVVLDLFKNVSSIAFDRVMDVNFKGVVYGTRAAISLMESSTSKGEASIVNMASVAGTVPCTHMSSYVASKHAVSGFTRAIRLEYGLLESPLKFILVSPGFVRTAIMEPQNGVQLTEYLNSVISDPKKVAREIVSGVKKGKIEITPTWNGRLALSLHRISPRITARSARMLTAKNWKEALGLKTHS